MPGKIIVIFMLWILIPVFDVAAGPNIAPPPVISNGNGNNYVPIVDNNSCKAFEGTLHYILEINGIQQDFRYRIRRGLVRIEIDDPHMGGTMTILAAPDDNRMLVLIHEQRAFTEFTMEDFANHDNLLIHKESRLNQTGNIQEIDGIEIYEFLITTENGEELRFWSPRKTTRYGLFQFPDFIDRVLSKMLKKDLPEGLFPFSVSYQGKRSTIDITLAGIQEEILDMNLFTVPANYRKLPIILPDY